MIDPTEHTPPYFAKTQKNLAVALGSNVTLECAAVGYPVPKITWHKHHGNLPFSRHRQVYGKFTQNLMLKNFFSTFNLCVLLI